MRKMTTGSRVCISGRTNEEDYRKVELAVKEMKSDEALSYKNNNGIN